MSEFVVDVALPGGAAYKIHIGRNFQREASLWSEWRNGATRAVIVTQPEIARIYGDAMANSLREGGFSAVNTIMFPDGECNKTLESVELLYNALYDLDDPPVDRKTLIVALGGGVVGDVAGYVAATYLRGLRYVQVPTTLLAMVDSSVGGKTGVDFRAGKNLVGAFHHPVGVLADVRTLDTLPMREVRAGLAEVVKYGILSAPELLNLAEEYARAEIDDRIGFIANMVARCCAIKAGIVVRDEREENGLRAALNFGHTIGHAVESATNYARFLHGEAVALGMVAACHIGEAAGVSPPDVRATLLQTLTSTGLPTACPPDLDAETLIALTARDKKAVGGTARFVLAERIGMVGPPVALSLEVVREGLRRWRQASEPPKDVAGGTVA